MDNNRNLFLLRGLVVFGLSLVSCNFSVPDGDGSH